MLPCAETATLTPFPDDVASIVGVSTEAGQLQLHTVSSLIWFAREVSPYSGTPSLAVDAARRFRGRSSKCRGGPAETCPFAFRTSPTGSSAAGSRLFERLRFYTDFPAALPRQPIDRRRIQDQMTPQRPSIDGRLLTRSEANLLLIELNGLPANAGTAVVSAATLVKQASAEQLELPLLADQARALKRALEGIRLKRRSLPTGLEQLRAHLHD